MDGVIVHSTVPVSKVIDRQIATNRFDLACRCADQFAAAELGPISVNEIDAEAVDGGVGAGAFVLLVLRGVEAAPAAPETFVDVVWNGSGAEG